MFAKYLQIIARMFRSRSCVGLDIGSTSLRVTRFRRGLTGPDEIMCLHRDLLVGGSAVPTTETVARHLRVVFQEHGFGRIPVVVAMPTHWLFSRILTVPFTDPKKVAQVIPFETEALIPFGLDEVVIDHTVIDTGEGESTVLVAAVPRDRMAQQLELLADAGVDPMSIDLDCLALFHFYRYAFMDSTQDMILLDVGASKSTVCLVAGGRLRAIRSFMIAGDVLTRNLEVQHGWTRAMAETEKRRLVVPAPDNGFDTNDATSKALQAFLDSFTTEIRNTIQAYEASADRTITQLYLCGGGARLKGFSDYLAQRLHLQAVDSPDGRLKSAKHKGAPWDGDCASSLGLAAAAALWADGGSLNLRQGPFSIPHRERSAKQRGWIRLAIGVAVLVVIGFANFYVEYTMKETRFQNLKDTLQQDFRTSFPDIKTVVDPVQQGQIALDQATQRLAVFGHNDPAAILLILAELTDYLPTDRAVDINELTVEGAKVKIEASTNSFEAVDAIKAALTKSERLVEVVVSDARMGATPGQVKFSVTALVTAE